MLQSELIYEGKVLRAVADFVPNSPTLTGVCTDIDIRISVCIGVRIRIRIRIRVRIAVCADTVRSARTARIIAVDEAVAIVVLAVGTLSRFIALVVICSTDIDITVRLRQGAVTVIISLETFGAIRRVLRGRRRAAEDQRQERDHDHHVSLQVSPTPIIHKSRDLKTHRRSTRVAPGRYSEAMNRRLPAVHALIVVSVLLALHQGWTEGLIGGGFHPGHVWAVDQVATMMFGAESWSGWTGRIGAPDPVHLRLIGWAPLLIAAPLSILVGAGAAMWVAIMVGYIATARLTAALLQRVTRTEPIIAAAASTVYVFSPFALGVLANGQLAKMQLWCLPLLLLATERWRETPSLRRGVEVLGTGAIMGFTSPSIGLVAPVALGTWLLLRIRWTRRGIGLAVGALTLTALGLAIPWAMHTVEVGGTAGLIPAAPVPGLQHPPALSPIATPGSLFMATGPWDGSHAAINNIAGLGAPALLGAAAALLMAWRKMALAAGLVLAGAVFALGPSIEAFGFKWLMPAYLMELTHYPIIESGMYYRFSQVATLGLALALCRLAAAVPRHAVLVAVVVATANLAESVRETRRLWPRTLTAIPNADLMASIASDPVPGAVLELPLAHLDTEGERRLLGQLIHQRPTTVLARNMVVRGQPRLERLERLSTDATGLKQAGFRYVLLHNPARHRRVFNRLESKLGPSQGTRQLGLWVVP